MPDLEPDEQDALIGMIEFRVNLELRPSLVARIDSLMAKTDAGSREELLRRALELYEYAVTAKDKGDTLLLRTAEGAYRELDPVKVRR